MHIIVATDAFYPQVNGVVRTLEALVQAWKEQGHTVGVITPTCFYNFSLPVYNEIKIAYWNDTAMLDKAIILPARIFIATEGPVGHFVRRYCLQRGLPFTTAYYTNFPEQFKSVARIPLCLTYPILRRFHSHAYATIVSTETMRKHLCNKGFKGNIQICPKGIDTELFKPYYRQVRDKPICTYVGRISAEKGIDDFLSCDIDCHKVVVGDGPQLSKLRSRFPDVTYTGYLRGEALAKAYSDADVMVFPSRTETFGLVILEALSCGCPVAAYPVQGPIDIIKNDCGVGHLDWNLRDAILRAVKESDRQKCREFALQYNTWSESAKILLDNMVVATN